MGCIHDYVILHRTYAAPVANETVREIKALLKEVDVDWDDYDDLDTIWDDETLQGVTVLFLQCSKCGFEKEKRMLGKSVEEDSFPSFRS